MGYESVASALREVGRHAVDRGSDGYCFLLELLSARLQQANQEQMPELAAAIRYLAGLDEQIGRAFFMYELADKVDALAY